MPAVSPILRLTLGLILLTVSILLLSDLLGLTSDSKQVELSARKAIAEALAVQVSVSISQGRLDAVADTLRELHERNDAVVSVALRTADGRLRTAAGDHAVAWEPVDGDKSTVNHVQVPIHGESGRWGTLEVSFEPLGGSFSGLFTRGSFTALVVFVAVAGFLAYWLFLKRALNELDPSAVIPDRVRAALDVLVEGLVMLDRDERIVLVNAAFERKFGQTAEALIGRKLSRLEWLNADEERPEERAKLPWVALLDKGAVPTSVALKLRTPIKEKLRFMVNAAPIKAQDGTLRGSVVTFDDVTLLERKNADLELALDRLKKSQHEITRQNRELQVLATRDPLTSVLNRRSLFEGLAALLREAAQEGTPLSCIMVDIDHFKSINDRFGHATGDKVIKLLARILTDTVRADDLVGRYGGEEFCVILPAVGEDRAAEIAERMRFAVRDGKSAKFTSAIQITASFGVSSTMDGTLTPGDLVDRADKALYVAKESGRNRVARWSNALAARGHDSDGPSTDVAPGPAAAMATPVARETSDSVVDEDSNSMRERIVELEAVIRKLNEARAVDVEASGKPSRAILYDRIRQAIERNKRYGTRLAMLMIDVDTVRVVDNTLGHSAAEKLTKMTASRLRRILRSSDTIAFKGMEHVGVSVSQLGRGEFGILLADLSDADATTWVVQRVVTTLAEPIELDGNDIFLNISMGVSLYPMDGEEPEALVASAGVALREARAAPGREACMFHSADMNRRSKEQLFLESELHRAEERGDLFLEYQPSVDVRTGQVVGLEALLRWRHPERGLVSPELFVPIAEHTGLINEIGNWVLKTACHQLKLWQEAGHSQLVMAINFSAVQLRKRNLAERVIAAVANAGLSPKSVVVELTESALIQNLDTAVDLVEELHQSGLTVAIDDFGTGYSSLGYLKRFPIDVVKVDRSFMRDFPGNAHDRTIVSAIIAMAHSLGLGVVAEGVETEEQLRVLQTLQCDQIQGFLFSRPLAREHMTSLLAQAIDIRRMVRSTSLQATDSTRITDTPVAGVLNAPPVRSATR